jgi:putative DNA primase/helicase
MTKMQPHANALPHAFTGCFRKRAMADVLKLTPQMDARVNAEHRALPNASGFICNDKGRPLAIEANAITVIEGATRFGGLFYDTLRESIRITDSGESRGWTDDDDLAALEWMQREAGLPGLRLGVAQNAVRRVASKRHRDPLLEWFADLPQWDDVPRVEAALCDAWGVTDTVITRATSRNFFRALAARGTIPAAKVDTIFVFEGPQGVLKSTALELLGGEFYAEISAPIGSADFAREIRAVLIAELGELSAMRGREAQQIKQALSRRYDRYVEKYERNPREYPRRCVFVGTTNDETYWHDSTGARRLVPVRVGDIRLDLIRDNRAQWLAEALSDIKSGQQWHEWPEGIDDEREERQDIDPWELTLRDMIANGRQVGADSLGREPWPTGWISSAEIMRSWLRLEPHQQGRGAGARIGHVMRRLGYCPRNKGHENVRGWEHDAKFEANKCSQG